MILFLLTIRFLLAAVLLTAGASKLVDHEGSRKAIVGFGFPESLAGPAAWVLVLVELALAIALIPTITFPFATIAALSLFFLFAVGTYSEVSKGNKTNCHCFGQLHSAPMGWQTIVRNIVLTVLSGILMWQFNRSASTDFDLWMKSLSNAERIVFAISSAGAVLLVIVLFLLLKVLNQQKELAAQIEELQDALDETQVNQSTKHRDIVFPASGLPIGGPAPAFALSDLNGQQQSLDNLLSGGKPVLLLFASPSCGPCETLLPDITRWQSEYADRLQVVLLSAGSEKDNRAKYADKNISTVLLQGDSGVDKAYEAHWTPTAVLVGANGTIASNLAAGSDAIKSLVAESVKSRGAVPWTGNSNNGHDHHHVGVLQFGQPAPRFSLKDLDGNSVSLSDLAGSKTLIIFWSPECSFCLEMTRDLKSFEASRRNGGPQLLFISRGTAEANRALGLTSTVLLDQATVVLKQYGASGTPSGILIDEQGKTASLLEAGGPNVLGLLGIKQDAKSAIQE